MHVQILKHTCTRGHGKSHLQNVFSDEHSRKCRYVHMRTHMHTSLHAHVLITHAGAYVHIYICVFM